MTIHLSLLIALAVAHCLGDWVWQSYTPDMGVNKSKDNLVLATHVGQVTICYMLATGWFIYPHVIEGGKWAAFLYLNYLLHFATDYVTSRSTAKLWYIDVVEVTRYWKHAPEQTLHEPDGIFVHAQEPAYKVTVNEDKRAAFFSVIGLDQLIHALCLYVTAAYFLE